MSPEVQGGYAEYVRIGLPESIKIPNGVSWDFANISRAISCWLTWCQSF